MKLLIESLLLARMLGLVHSFFCHDEAPLKLVGTLFYLGLYAVALGAVYHQMR